MKNLGRSSLGILVAGALSFGAAISSPQSPSSPSGGQEKARGAGLRATGTFEVKLTPQKPDDETQDPTLARMSIEKTFAGDLAATSKGQMLSAMTATPGSAGYVAIERVDGKLGGKSGTFVLQHSGTMTRGKPELSVTVVPDSGTGELAGLAGKMTIEIDGGKHSYAFEYTLAESAAK